MAESAKAQLKRAMKASGLEPNALRRAATRAINKTTVSLRAEAARRVKEHVNLKAADAKDAIAVERAKLRGGMPFGRLVIAAKAVELYKFGAKMKAVGEYVGVTVKVKKERKLVKGGFIATMKSGKTSVWKRTSGVTKKGKARLKMLFSTRVSDVFQNDDFMSGLVKFARERLGTVMRQEIAFESSKKSQGGPPSEQ